MFSGHFQDRARGLHGGVLIVCLTAVLAVTCTSPAFAAKKPTTKRYGTQLTVSPKRPKATDGLSVAFRAGTLRRDERYLISFGDGGGLPANVQCTSGYQVLVKGRHPARKRVELTLYPNQVIGVGSDAHFVFGVLTPSGRRFCAGLQSVQLSRIDPDGNVNYIASRQVRVAKDSGYPEPDGTGTAMKISLLDGSSIKVEAPGRPDRTLSLTGTLRGVIPNVFRPNTDVNVGSMTGAMYLTSISPDALCAGSTYKVELGLAQGGPSNMLLEASGNSILTLELLADPLSAAGCAAPAAPSRTTVTLSGRATQPDGLTRLPLSGTVKDVQIAPGVQATVTFNLQVAVDLSGHG